jgi:anaerobic selenocysteine-containing dehydrogenase
MPETHHRACHLCEAICGVVIEHDGGKVTSIKGDRDDPFSRGHICPKAAALGDIHHDPDRLKRPLRRRGKDFEEIDWDTALDEAAAMIAGVQRKHGRDAVGTYTGNPVAHNYASALYAMGVMPEVLRTKQRFSSQSIDNLPRMFVSYQVFGSQVAIPVPDLDRTSFFLVVGANPLVSNGSVMTAPDIGKRLAAIQSRGGNIVVIDPRRSETAKIADEHHFIVPGSDALFLLSFLHVLFAENLDRIGRHADVVLGLDDLRDLAARFPPSRVETATGIAATEVQRLARAFAAAPSAICYGRIGVSIQEFGALATWLIDCINIVTGNLDRAGGVMFTTPAVDVAALADMGKQHGTFDRWRSRVRGLPEFNGELPVAVMAEEIDTPGEGQIRALITSAGNPVLSAPNGPRLERGLAGLEAMISIDIYLNETTRHAHYILPPTFALEHEHYDVVLHAVAVRNTAKWSAPLFSPAADQRHDWQIYLGLLSRLDDGALGKAKGALMQLAGTTFSPERMIDLLIRMGPYGDKLLPWKTGLTLAKVKAAVHGLDLGPLQEGRLADFLFHDDRRVHLAPRRLVADVDRLETRFAEQANAALPLSLIGRRELRSNNSWMHNSARLVKGRVRCTLLMHPRDAAARGLVDGARVTLRSRVGEIVAPLEISDEVMPGVVSLPHGYGHDREGARLSVASERPGVSANDVTDDAFVDRLCGNAAVNGVRVEVSPCSRTEPASPSS